MLQEQLLCLLQLQRICLCIIRLVLVAVVEIFIMVTTQTTIPLATTSAPMRCLCRRRVPATTIGCSLRVRIRSILFQPTHHHQKMRLLSEQLRKLLLIHSVVFGIMEAPLHCHQVQALVQPFYENNIPLLLVIHLIVRVLL